MARIGVLTGGGDCPGLNAVIRAVVRKGIDQSTATSSSASPTGGPESSTTRAVELGDHDSTRGILHRGGTILGTSRTNPFKAERPRGRGRAQVARGQRGIDILIPIGGEDTLGVAGKLAEAGHPGGVGVPKTIDNDLAGTDFTFGFQTAVQIATDAIDRLHTTAESHNRVIVVEVMGRHAGWIAAYFEPGRRRRPRSSFRAAVRHRGGVRAPAPPPREGAAILDRGRLGGRDAQGGHGRADDGCRVTAPTRSGTSAWAGSLSVSSARSRSAPASRRA